MTQVAAGLSLTLPRAGALTDVLNAAPTGTPSAEDLRVLGEQLAGDLAALVEELPAGERLRLDDFRFALARDHPERVGGGDGDFVASPVTARRSVGLAAVARCVRGRSPSPATAVAEVLAAGAEDAGGSDPTARAPWWAGWYGGLTAGGRAMVEAEAVTWATQLWTALAWERLAQTDGGRGRRLVGLPRHPGPDAAGTGRGPGPQRGATRAAGGRIRGPSGATGAPRSGSPPSSRRWRGGSGRSRPGWWGCGRRAGRCGSSPSTAAPWPRRRRPWSAPSRRGSTPASRPTPGSRPDLRRRDRRRHRHRRTHRRTHRVPQAAWPAVQSRRRARGQVFTMRSSGVSASTAWTHPWWSHSSWPGAWASVSMETRQPSSSA